MPPGQFVEVYLNAPLEVCEQRDSKGPLRQSARRRNQGVHRRQRPLRAAPEPELELPTAQLPVGECVARILAFLAEPEKQHRR